MLLSGALNEERGPALGACQSQEVERSPRWLLAGHGDCSQWGWGWSLLEGYQEQGESEGLWALGSHRDPGLHDCALLQTTAVTAMKTMATDAWPPGRWHPGGGPHRPSQHQMGLQDCSRQAPAPRLLVTGGTCPTALSPVELAIGIVFLSSKGNRTKRLLVCDQMWAWCAQG